MQLSLGQPRRGPGLYDQLTDHWAWGAHGFEIGAFGMYSLSGRYDVSCENLSVFLEPALGFSHITTGSDWVSPGSFSIPEATSSGWMGSLELGIEYRFDFGLNLDLSGGITYQSFNAIIPDALGDLKLSFSFGLGYAF